MELLPCHFCWSNELNKTEHRSYEEIWFGCGASNSSDAWNNRNSAWISVKDRLPEIDTFILMLKGKYIMIGFFDIDKVFVFDNEEINNITHWMPLPQIPE